MQVDRRSIVIVIPVYKSSISANEKLSLEQVLKVLKSYDISFVAPENLSFQPGQLIPGNSLLEKATVIRFPDKWFSSVIEYSKLLVSKEFYHSFERYSFMLLYQMDAYVFRDDLQEWASKGYDYIGAPWIKEDETTMMRNVCRGKWKYIFSFMRFINRVFFGKKDYAIGNGGMSLRNIQRSLMVLDKLSFIAKGWGTHEDLFWSMAVPMLYPFFKVPNMNEAYGFSFERDPEKFLELNNNQLPFGCHAWEKYSPEFWKKHIPIIN